MGEYRRKETPTEFRARRKEEALAWIRDESGYDESNCIRAALDAHTHFEVSVDVAEARAILRGEK